MSLRNLLNENVILPAGDLLTGQRVRYHLHKVRQAARWPQAELLQFQSERLAMLMPLVAKKVPYYREWFMANHLVPSQITTVEDLRQLPIVDKATMRREGIDRFAVEGFPAHKRITYHSSGSTGTPFAYYSTAEAYSANMACKIYTWEEAGYRLGDPYMKIANSPRHGRLKRWQDQANNCVYEYFNALDDSRMDQLLLAINKQRPTIVRSYPSPLYLLACRAKQTGMLTHRPQHIMTTGATLSDSYRSVIEEVFACDVIDSYSCEGTPNTHETPQHDGYHVDNYYGVIEVLDDDGQPVRDGIGRVVATDWWNTAMPFLRYDTQDLVEVQQGQIVRIVGRDADCILSTNGKHITTNNLDKYFAYYSTLILAYQMVHHSNGQIVLRLEVTDAFTPQMHVEIRSYWSQLVGQPIEIELHDHLPLMHNNKYLTIINETD